MQNYLPSYAGSQLLDITAAQANTEVTVEVPRLKFKQKKTLNAKESVTIKLPRQVEMSGSKNSLNTVQIRATADVSVISGNVKKFTLDTSVVYPTSAWGKEYFVSTPFKTTGNVLNEFSVTNGKETNTVKIIPGCTIRYMGTTYWKGHEMKIVLQPYESAQIQSRTDFSGTSVTSEHPVAVAIGNTCTWVFTKCDHVYEQILPVNSWGSSYIVPPVSLQNKYDSIYIQASQNTRVTVRGSGKRVILMTKGRSEEIRSHTSVPLVIEADHGIQVLMLYNGAHYGGRKAYDPFLTTLLPNNHFCSLYSFTGLKGFQNQALIVAQTGAQKKMIFDGKKLQNVLWKRVPGMDFSWAWMRFIPHKRHILSSSGSPFALYTAGFSYMSGFGTVGQCLEPGELKTL